MSAFGKKYSDEQVQAIVEAVLDGVDGQPGSGPLGQGDAELGRQMTAKEAQAAAREGRLPGLPGFEMNLSTVRNYCQKERQDRAGKTPNRLDRKTPEEISGEFYRRAIRMAESTMRQLEAKIKRGKGSAKDAAELLDLAAKVDKLSKQRMTRPARPEPAGPGDTGGQQDAGGAAAEPDDFAAQLAAQARDTPAPSDQTPQTTETAKGTPETTVPAQARSDRAAADEHGDSGDRFPVRAESSSSDAGRLAAAQALLSPAG